MYRIVAVGSPWDWYRVSCDRVDETEYCSCIYRMWLQLDGDMEARKDRIDIFDRVTGDLHRNPWLPDSLSRSGSRRSSRVLHDVPRASSEPGASTRPPVHPNVEHTPSGRFKSPPLTISYRGPADQAPLQPTAERGNSGRFGFPLPMTPNTSAVHLSASASAGDLPDNNASTSSVTSFQVSGGL